MTLRELIIKLLELDNDNLDKQVFLLDDVGYTDEHGEVDGSIYTIEHVETGSCIYLNFDNRNHYMRRGVADDKT